MPPEARLEGTPRRQALLFRSCADKLLMTTLSWVRFSSIVGVYWSSSSKSPDTRWHSRWHFHLSLLPIAAVLGGILKENVHERILVPRSRLRLWAGHADPAHHHRADASGTGQAPGRLPKSGGGNGKQASRIPKPSISKRSLPWPLSSRLSLPASRKRRSAPSGKRPARRCSSIKRGSPRCCPMQRCPLYPSRPRRLLARPPSSLLLLAVDRGWIGETRPPSRPSMGASGN